MAQRFPNTQIIKKNNKIIRIAISCVFAFVVLALCWVVITLLGWNESIGAKGLSCGVSIGAGTWMESWLKKKRLSFKRRIKPHVTNNKQKNYKWILFVVLFAMVLIPILLLFLTENCYKKEFEEAKQNNTIDAYMNFVNNHPNHVISYEARDSIVSIYRRDYAIVDIPVTQEGLDNTLKSKLKVMQMERIDEAYKKAKETQTIEGWKYYMEIVPSSEWRDAQTQIDWISEANFSEIRKKQEVEERARENALWETDDSAWEVASTRDNISSYKNYLKLYPYGNHCGAAEKRLIDLEVDKVFAGDHGKLPPMDKSYSMGTSYSILELENRTDYNLTINYSGPDSKRIVIPPHQTGELRIDNGTYRIAASVGHGVRPYAGEEKLYGCRYSSYFYIITY